MPRFPVIVLLAALVGLTACSGGGAGPAAPGDVVERFIEHDAGSPGPAGALWADTTVFDWRWDGGDDPIVRPGDGAKVGPGRRGGLLIRIEGEPCFVDLEVDLSTGTVDRIEVEASGWGRAPLGLAWRTRSAALGADLPKLGPVMPEAVEGGVRFTFAVVDHEAWRDRLDRIRLLVPAEAGSRSRIRAVRGVARRIAETELDEITNRAHKVDLGHDARNALLALPGVAHRRFVQVPAGARLTFAFGVPPDVGSPVRFTVRALSPDGDTATLFERDAGPGTGASEGRWHEAAVDLGDLAGGAVTLELTADTDSVLATDAELPAWANPEIVAPADRSGRPNVVVILLDTLRADGLSCYGNPLPTSPNLDAWAADRAVRFANTVAGAPWTLPSHASLFTGLDAVRHGVNFNSPVSADLDLLAERLRAAGYTTAAITGGAYLRPRWGFSQGFDSFAYWAEEKNAGELSWVTDRTLEWLDRNRDRSFFLFVHSYEVHYPHRRRQPHFSRFARLAGVDPSEGVVQMRKHGWQGLVNEGDYLVIRRPGTREFSNDLTDLDTRTIRLMYDSAVAYADAKVREILDRLEALGLDDDTMVIVTSDHGEALGEDGRAGHSFLEDYNALVPLLIGLPDAAGAGTVVDRQVRLIDLAPTIYEAAGIEPPDGLDGRSLMSLLADPDGDHPRHAFTYAGSSNRGLGLRVDNAVKYVFPDPAWAELADREALHDLIADPDERHDIADADPRLDELRGLTMHTIDDQHNGYRLTIANAGPEPLTGRLTGSWVQHDRVKVADHGCRCIHWRPGAAASFELAAGDRVELLFAEIPSPDVGLVAGLDPGTQDAVGLDLERLGLPVALAPHADGWRLTENAEAPPETGFWLHRVGERTALAAAPPPTDANLVEQLRALGYVE